MLFYRLGKKLELLTSVGDPMPSIVFRLLQVADREGWLKELLRSASLYNPGNLRLAAFATTHLTDAFENYAVRNRQNDPLLFADVLEMARLLKTAGLDTDDATRALQQGGTDGVYGIANKMLGLAVTLAGSKGDLGRVGTDKRTRLANHISRVAGCLQGIVDSDEAGKEIYGGCAELNEYLTSFRELLEQVLPEGRAARYVKELDRAANHRAFLFAHHAPEDYKVIREAAGMLRALASELQV